MAGSIMRFFVTARSNAAPFVSDDSAEFFEAQSDDPEAAMAEFVAKYKHPMGLYAAELHASADAFHCNAKPLWVWRSQRCLQKLKGPGDELNP